VRFNDLQSLARNALLIGKIKVIIKGQRNTFGYFLFRGASTFKTILEAL